MIVFIVALSVGVFFGPENLPESPLNRKHNQRGVICDPMENNQIVPFPRESPRQLSSTFTDPESAAAATKMKSVADSTRRRFCPESRSLGSKVEVAAHHIALLLFRTIAAAFANIR
jgi:hypothetical protein